MSRALEQEWPNVFTPSMLADRWACSERHIRNMIDRGELPAFRLGGKLIRIRPEDVEAFECQSGDLPASKENTASLGTIQPFQPDGDVIDLERQISKRRPASPRLDTRNSRGLQGRR